MTEAEFLDRMREIDRKLADQGVPVSARLVLAYFPLSGRNEFEVEGRDPNLGSYEGINLYWSMVDWYTERYPKQARIGYEWGPRLMVIRGEVFRADIPVHFNPRNPFNAFTYLRDVPTVLVKMLDPAESSTIQWKYNWFFRQASCLALCWTNWCAPRRSDLVSELIDRGWRDLRSSCEAFCARTPDAVLFSIQQGPEKYLKALLSACDLNLTETDLKKRFGHKLPKLLESCAAVDPRFSEFDGRIGLLDYGPDVRYHRQGKSPSEVVEIVDLAHDLCYTVALHLLEREQGRASPT
jgi:hypothetical protein